MSGNKLFAAGILLLGAVVCAQAGSGATAKSGVCLTEPEKVGSANEYLDSGMQNFVELSYGYMAAPGPEAPVKPPKHTPRFRDAYTVPEPVNQTVQPEKEAVASASIADDIIYLPDLSLKSAAPVVPQANKKPVVPEGLLGELNGPIFERFSKTGRIKNHLYGGDFRPRTVQDRGALGAVVPPVESAGREKSIYNFAMIAVDIAAAARDGGLAARVAKISEQSGFIAFEDDFNIQDNGEIALVRGWLLKDKEAGLRSSGLVADVKLGKRVCEFAPGQTSFVMPVVVTILVPSNHKPVEFMNTVIGRLHNNAGFAWKKTITAKALPLPDSAGGTAYLIKVAGRLPIDAFRLAAGYPFVDEITPAPIKHARGL